MKFKLFSYRFLLFIFKCYWCLSVTHWAWWLGMMLYTILSNMLVMSFMGDMIWRMVRGRSTQTQGYLRAVTMSIMAHLNIYHYVVPS